MSKPFSFRDMIVVDQTEGSWDDAIGLIAYQYKKRRRGIIGESHDECPECESEPCECDESFEAQFDALTPTAEAALTGAQRADMNRVNAGAMSQDEYRKKYKLGKYRVGSKTALGGSLYKNLVKKEDLEADDQIDEAVLSREQERAKNSDFDRVMAGAMKRDDYNKKWKLGKYKVAEPNAFIAKMIAPRPKGV